MVSVKGSALMSYMSCLAPVFSFLNFSQVSLPQDLIRRPPNFVIWPLKDPPLRIM